MAQKTVTNKKTSFNADSNPDIVADFNSGAATDATQRVILANNQDAVAVTGAFYQATQPVSGTVSVGTVSITANSAVNVAQINGVTPLMGNGATGTGAPRVSIASDSTGIVGLFPTTSGGLTTYHLVSAATTNATNLKASAGQVFGWYIFNSNAAARKVAFHNASGTPTAGASIFFAIVIPATSAANVFSDVGIAFSTGIAITTVTDLTDAGATAVAASDLIINIFYK